MDTLPAKKNNKRKCNKRTNKVIRPTRQFTRSLGKNILPSTSQCEPVLISDSEDEVFVSPNKKRRIESSELIVEHASEVLIADDDFISEDDDTKYSLGTCKSNEKKWETELIGEHISEVLISDDDSEEEYTKSSLNSCKINETNIKTERFIKKLDSADNILTDDEDTELNNIVKSNIKTEELTKMDPGFYTLSDDEDTEPFQPINIVKEETDNKSEANNINKRIKIENIKCEWKEYELLSQQLDIKPNISKNLIKLFEDGNTIPFIARYRRDATENMVPEKLREVRDTFDEICHLKQKMQVVIKAVDKLGAMNPQLEKTIRSAKSIEELDIIYAPYKPGPKKTLAEKAKDLGLEKPAQNILQNAENVNLIQYTDVSNNDLNSIERVQKGIVHIIAYVMATDSAMLSYLRELRREINFILETKKYKGKQVVKGADNTKVKGKQIDEQKFQNYFDYKIPVKFVKPHQVLAINRGEHHKILSVKIIVPDIMFQKFAQFCRTKWLKNGQCDISRAAIIEEAIKDSYNRLVQPLIVREIRSELKTVAEKASYEVFSKNLKHLLLLAPLKGQPILAIDPGYKGGCKIAVVSKTGSVLGYDWIYPHENRKKLEAGRILKNMLREHECCLIALGNGTACRETEEWLTELIKTEFFKPLDVKYTIVTEDGASIYSCSPEARKEFPNLDTNIISAVSLARRIQDPLAELVKIEPQHLGVGMYQHDLKKKTLEEALNDVVSECVSFVGVDLNTASQCLLRKIAGLSDKRATQVIEYREKNGPFLYREQLKNVFGIGDKIFQQCAGFLRVGPASPKEAIEFYKNPKTTKLDRTYVHPESYKVAHNIMKKFSLNPNDVGEPYFITKILSLKMNPISLSSELKSSEETIKLIFDALSKPLNYDLRSEISQQPLFRKGITSMRDLTVGTTVTGRVKNVTHFGCFIDVGVETDALLHQSKMKGIIFNLGDRITAKVDSIDVSRQRIGLKEAFLNK